MTFLNGQYFEMFGHFVGLTVALDQIAAAAAATAPAEAVAEVSENPEPALDSFAPASLRVIPLLSGGGGERA
jgi:hypothetical protein